MNKKDFHTFIHTLTAHDAGHEHRSMWRLQMVVFDLHEHGNYRCVQSMQDYLVSQQCLKPPTVVSNTKIIKFWNKIGILIQSFEYRLGIRIVIYKCNVQSFIRFNIHFRIIGCSNIWHEKWFNLFFPKIPSVHNQIFWVSNLKW